MRAIVCDKCDKILPMDGDYRVLMPMKYNELDCLQAVGGDRLRFRCDDSPHLCLDCFEDFKRWVERREEPVACGDPE